MKSYIFLLLSLPGICLSANLTVTVNNIKNTNGQVLVGLFNSKKTFPTKGQEYKGNIVYPINSTSATTTFNNIPSGNYAIAVIHDEDRSGKLEKNIFGIPMEQYGFSNDVYAKFGPPTFESAAFTVNKEDLLITINLK